jgi:hypothetical protein
METLFGFDPIDEIVAALQAVTYFDRNGNLQHWPADDKRDRQVVVQIKQQHPDLDLAAMIPKFSGHQLDVENTTKVVRMRARFQEWCDIEARNRASWRERRNGTKRPRGNGSSTGGAPLPADKWTKSGRVDF